MTTILKSEKYSIDFRKKVDIGKLLDISWINNLQKEIFIKEGMVISEKQPFFIIENSCKFDFNEMLPLDLHAKYSNYILEIKNKNKIFVTNENELLKYVYLDIYLYLELILDKINKKESHVEYSKKLQNIIEKQIGFNNIRENETSGNSWKRSDLLQKNSNAIEWNKNKSLVINREITINLEKINAEVVEIPNSYDKERLNDALCYINQLLSELNLKTRNFKLRFKKLKLYKKEGMFFKDSNSIIVDPRHIDAFKHELGHFIYENNLPITLSNKRLYSADYKAIVKRLGKDKSFKKICDKMHLLEDYEIESEMFAYWFEKQ